LTLQAIDQLPRLRRIWFSSNHTRGLPKGVAAFMTEIQNVSDKKNRPLHAVYIYASAGFPFSHIYTKDSIHSVWTPTLRYWESKELSLIVRFPFINTNGMDIPPNVWWDQVDN